MTEPTRLAQPSAAVAAGDRIIGLTVFLVTGVVVLLLWSNPERAWMHPELATLGRRVATAPGTFESTIRLILDWHHFADDPQRARYLSGFFDVIDAVVRPYVARVFAHPSLGVTTILYVTLIPLFLYRTLRLFLLSSGQSFLFCALLIASPGFLSNLFAYFHTAKPLSFILLAATIYLATLYSIEARTRYALVIGVVLFLGFFSDELLLWSLFFVPAYAALTGARARSLKKLCYVLIATVGSYLVMLLLLMPWLEREFGTPSGNVPRPYAVFSMIPRLFSGDYYVDAAWITARSVLATFGSATTNSLAVSMAGICIIACVAALIALSGWRHHKTWKLAAVSLFALCSFSLFGVWLLYYSGPPALAGFAALNYYYNSPISYLVVMCLAAAFNSVDQMLSNATMRQYVTAPLAIVICAVIVSSMSMFSKLNDVVRFIHLGPIDTTRFFSVVSDGYDFPKPTLTINTGNSSLFNRLFARAQREGMALFGRYSVTDLNAAYYDRSYYQHGMQFFGSSFAAAGQGYGTELCFAFFGNNPCPVIFRASPPSDARPQPLVPPREPQGPVSEHKS